MVTNALGPLRVIETLEDLVEPSGTIGVMSSGQGSVTNNERGGHEVYRGSKAALNTFMRSYAARHSGERRTLVLMAPGWVKTDMGGPQAPMELSEGGKTSAALATLPDDGPTGGFFHLGKALPW